MISVSRLHLLLHPSFRFLLRPVSFPFLLLLLALQTPPLVNESLALLLEFLSVDVWAQGGCVPLPCLQFRLELFDISLAAHLVRVGGPLLESGDVEG
jgi:hypothetical protein